jgi:hypothetical protein
MPLHHGRRLDQYHRVNDLRPNPVEPHPQEPVERCKLRPTGPLSVQDGQLMLQGNKLKLQRSAAAKTEDEDRNNGGENRHHAVTVRLACENLQCFSALWILSKDSHRGNRDHDPRRVLLVLKRVLGSGGLSCNKEIEIPL